MTRPAFPVTGTSMFKAALLLIMCSGSVGTSSGVIAYPPEKTEQNCAAADMPVASRQILPEKMAFLIGAQKSGTTFLFDELIGRHPKIRSQVIRMRKGREKKVKEPHFFAEQPLRNFDEYLWNFTHGRPDPSVTYMDGTPNYLPIPAAAARVASAFPAARIVVVLRDPVDRALSAWNMQRTRGRNSARKIGRMRPGQTDRAFDQLVYEELEMLRASNCSFEPPVSSAGRVVAPAATAAAAVWTRTPGLPSWNQCNKCIFRCGTFQWQEGSKPSAGSCKYYVDMLLRRGLYVYQLEWWLQHFKPEQLFVINQEELYADSDGVLKRLITFLGQDPALLRPKSSVESGWSLPMERNTTQVYASVIADMYRFFEHANVELYRLMASIPAWGWKGEFPNQSGGKAPLN